MKWSKQKIDREGTYVFKTNRNDTFELVSISFDNELNCWWTHDYPDAHSCDPFENDGSDQWICLEDVE